MITRLPENLIGFETRMTSLILYLFFYRVEMDLHFYLFKTCKRLVSITDNYEAIVITENQTSLRQSFLTKVFLSEFSTHMASDVPVVLNIRGNYHRRFVEIHRILTKYKQFGMVHQRYQYQVKFKTPIEGRMFVMLNVGKMDDPAECLRKWEKQEFNSLQSTYTVRP